MMSGIRTTMYSNRWTGSALSAYTEKLQSSKEKKKHLYDKEQKRPRSQFYYKHMIIKMALQCRLYTIKTFVNKMGYKIKVKEKMTTLCNILKRENHNMKPLCVGDRYRKGR